MANIIAPGKTIGILGGGQLGRMTAIAAAQLGYRTVIFAPEKDPPAGDVAFQTITADYDDPAALDAFASCCDVVTLEFENVPVSCLNTLKERVVVCPEATVLEVTQDRFLEKTALKGWGIGVTEFARIDRATDIAPALSGFGGEAILKTRRMGYDGKGQVKIASADEAQSAWKSLGEVDCILEAMVDFKSELSVIVARSASGELACFPPVENQHHNHILAKTIAPMDLPQPIHDEAVRMASHVAASLDVVGLISVEMFLTSMDTILVNELAPRPHNSGHWTIEGAVTSQFEQLVRAVCNLPLGDTSVIAPTVMTNLLGDQWQQAWPNCLSEKGCHLHLYGKQETKEGRKMGHITKVMI